MRSLLICLLSTLLSACGFHFAGHLDHAPPSIHFESDQPFSRFAKQFKRDVLAMHIALDPHAVDVVHLLDEHVHERRISMSSSTQVRQYVITFTIHYKLAHDDEAREIMVKRNFTVNESQMLGSSNERFTIIQEMHREASRRLIRILIKHHEIH